jgi:hypothetical protein
MEIVSVALADAFMIEGLAAVIIPYRYVMQMVVSPISS